MNGSGTQDGFEVWGRTTRTLRRCASDWDTRRTDVRRVTARWTRWFTSLLFAVLALCASTAYSASKPILVLGDSLSAEYGLVRGSGWVPLLEKRIRAEKIDTAIINASISGDTTSGGRSRLQALLDKHAPGIVIIELGANDGLRGLPVDATESNLRAMIKASKQAGARVLLVGMQIPPNYGGEYTRRFASMFPKLSKENNVPLVPFLLEGLVEKPQLFQSDRIHPTAQAQPILLDNTWPHLKPLLKN